MMSSWFNCYFCLKEENITEMVYDDDLREYCSLHCQHLQRNIQKLNACKVCAKNRGDLYLGTFLVKNRSPARPYFNSKNNRPYYVSRGDNKIYTQNYPKN